MPSRRPFCSFPAGCSNRVDSGRCEEHQHNRRGTQGVYQTRAWRRRSRQFLSKPENGDCIDCGAPATVSDHAPISRQELVAMGVEDPDADEHLQPRCGPCHSRRTALYDGGFGHPVRPDPSRHA